MNELITRHLMAETNVDEEARLREWRRASAENEARYRRRRQVWRLLDMAPAQIARPVPRANDLIARAGVYRLPTRSEPDAARPRKLLAGFPLRSRFAAVAALAAAAVVAAVLVLPRPAAEVTFGAAEFITGPHEVNTVRLDDGTVVHLAPGSWLAFEGRSTRVRRVRFEGVGYFAVAKDEARPFIILTEGGEAEVLGTRFELRAESKEMRVVVVEGRVALQAVGRRKEVNANQLGRAGANQPPTVVDVEDVNDFLGWVNGLFVFQSTPLRQVAHELATHYGIEIEIQSDALAEREVTAWLREQSFDSALTAICGAVGAACTIRRDRAIMHLPGPADRRDG